MRLLDKGLLGLLTGIAVSILMFGTQASLVNAQDGAPRAASRYRFVPDTGSKSNLSRNRKQGSFATSKTKFEDAQELEFEDSVPDVDVYTTSTKRTARRLETDFSFGRPNGEPAGSSSRIRAASYLAPKITSHRGQAPDQRFDRDFDYGHEGDFGQRIDQGFDQGFEQGIDQGFDQRVDQGFQEFNQGFTQEDFLDEEGFNGSPNNFLDGFAGPVQHPFRDQYQAFPSRTGAGTLYGKVAGTSSGGRPTDHIFGDPDQCCDEWSRFCPCFNPDYDCGCGGLKTNPRHRIFKCGKPSREPCDEVYGCKLSSELREARCRCANRRCESGGCGKCKLCPRKDECVDYGGDSPCNSCEIDFRPADLHPTNLGPTNLGPTDFSPADFHPTR